MSQRNSRNRRPEGGKSSNRNTPNYERKDFRDPFDPEKGPRKWLRILWYFVIGSETIYHVFKGLYLTAIFTVYEPAMAILSTPPDQRGVVGSTLFSLDEYLYHLQYGLRGPMVLFGAYLLYRYTCYLSPFKKKNPRGGRGSSSRNRGRSN